MKLSEIILTVFFLAFAFNSAAVRAQNSNSTKQIKILNNYGSIPFEDGNTIITEIKFTGLDSDYEQYDETVGRRIPESDLRNELREQRAMIDANDKFYGYKVSKVVKLLKEWISAKGYVDAEIVAFGEKLPRNRMNLIFRIERGTLARVSEIRFTGNTNVTGEEFVENFKQCSGDGWEIFATQKYDYYSRMCSQKLLQRKGFFEAKIRRVTPQFVAGNCIVTIEVEEGIRYRYGNFKIEGAKAFTEKEILEMSELKTGDVADGEALQEFLYKKLKEIYGDKGYVLYNAEFEPKFIKPQAKGLDGTVDVLITIDEGQLFRLTSIQFIGIEKEKADELRELFSLKEGEIYNQSKIEEGIKKMNETKQFYIADKDRDVEIRTNEETGDLCLVIRVKEID